MQFIRTTYVKRYVHAKGRKISRGALLQIDMAIQKLLDRVMSIHNGGRVLIDAELIELCRTRQI
jgi:hypothetical protein